MKYLVQLFRILVGGLFIFSGGVKANDVQGTAFKLEEYFQIFANEFPMSGIWQFFEEHSLTVAVIFVLLEIMLGVMLLLGYKRKLTLGFLLFTILFFTFLTFYSAQYNAVQDCGCFGDFIILEPWTSFYKDVILLIMIVFLVFGQKYIKPIFDQKTTYLILALSFLISCFIVWHGLNRLPIVDFRPFGVGDDIRDGLAYTPEESVQFYTMKNLNSGTDTIINSKDYINTGIWEDTLNYQFVGAIEGKDSIISAGVPAKIKNFEIVDVDGNELKDYALDAPQLMLIIYPEKEYCTVGEDNIKKLVDELKADDKQMEYLTLSSEPNIIDGIPSGILDDATMKQMIRSSPGVIFLKKGVVVGKYHYKNLPDDPQVIINLYK